MNHIDLVVAAAGVAVTVAAIILGAWFDLRPPRRDLEPRGRARERTR